MDLHEAFEILESEEKTPLTELKQRYRDLISIWHPDRHADNPRRYSMAQEKLKKINAAYDCICSHFAHMDTPDSQEKTKGQGTSIATCQHCGVRNKFTTGVDPDSLTCGRCGAFLFKPEGPKRHEVKEAPYIAEVKKQLPFAADDLVLFKEYFKKANKNYSYDEVVGLTFDYWISSDTVGLRRSSYISLRIHGRDGLVTVLFDMGRFPKKAEAIERVYDIMRVLTLESRYAYYISQMGKQGYIDYCYDDESKVYTGGMIPGIKYLGRHDAYMKDLMKHPTPQIHIYIYNTGVVKKGSDEVNLKICKQSGGFLMGNRKGKFLSLWDAFGPTPLKRNPYQIALSEKGLGWTTKKIIFEAKRDLDMITHILNELAEGKSF